jgi:DNA-binding FadR family transcriptional regulator
MIDIAEAARVPLMTPMINTLHQEAERFLNLTGALGRLKPSVNHGRLVEAIRNGDEDHIRTVVSDGLKRTQRLLLEALLGSPGVGDAWAVTSSPR